MKKVLEYLINLWYTFIRYSREDRDTRSICGVSMMKKVSIFDVATFFLNIVDRDSGSTITPLKLQKLLYYAQGYYLVINNKPLFKEEFQAWAHGPANPAVYNKYKEYGYGAIDAPQKEDIPEFDEKLSNFLYKIWNTFGIYDGKFLEELTHSEEPWINARKGYEPGEKCDKVISKNVMKEFFKTEPYVLNG